MEGTNIDSPDKAEIVAAINKQRINKSADPDGIPPELFKAERTVSANILKPLMEEFWQNETLQELSLKKA